jgi:hypothetical protein
VIFEVAPIYIVLSVLIDSSLGALPQLGSTNMDMVEPWLLDHLDYLLERYLCLSDAF